MISFITEFRGPYAFLSNFYPSNIFFEDIIFPTLEHAYQWQKASTLGDLIICHEIERVKSPGEAKKLGRKAQGDLRTWEIQRLPVMKKLLRLKFVGSELGDNLISTFPNVLIEGNTWKDCFWGYDFNLEQGMNWLGLLLMEVRNELMLS